MRLNPRKLLVRFPLLTRFVVLALLVLGAADYVYSRLLPGSLPPERLELFPDGSVSPVFIVRDAHGVPHILARTDADMFFAIGYAQAQDRLWQLELQRRMIHGEMSEVLGRASLQQDIWFRSLDLYAAAQTAWSALSEPARLSLQRYVDGLNAGMAAQSTLPVEFRLLGIRPQPWTAFDSLARLKLFALSLSGDFQLDLTREVARHALTNAQLRTLFPDSDLQEVSGKRRDPSTIPRSAVDSLPRTAMEVPSWNIPAAASCSAWAAVGQEAGAAAALLASHCSLGLEIPSSLYMVHATGETSTVSGMSLIGVPLVLFGHNARISWGWANLRADTEDVYFENIDADGVRYCAAPGQWVDLETRAVNIKVRVETDGFPLRSQQRTVSVVLRATRHGPLLSDQFGGFDRPVSLRWVGLDPADTSYEAWYRLQFAHDWQEFRAAMRLHATPALNMIYADIHGNIGSVIAGKLPIRSQGSGQVPAPGWDAHYAWMGYRPEEDLPAIYNPSTGWIVADGAEGIDTRSGETPTARARRIADLLKKRAQAGEPLERADMRRIQGDVVDPEAAALAVELVKLHPNGRDQALALRYLEGWNGALSADSPAAVIFSVWSDLLRQRLLDEELGWYWNKSEQGAYLGTLDERISAGTLQRALAECHGVWAPTPRTSRGRSGCDDLLQSTLQDALDRISGITGNRAMSQWRLDALQRGVYVHQPVGRWPLLERLFERGLPGDGDRNTVNAGGGVFVANEGFMQHLGGSFRQVISLGRRGVVQEFMNSTGQSGDVASPHYADMVAPFARLEYYRLDETVAMLPPSVSSSARSAELPVD